MEPYLTPVCEPGSGITGNISSDMTSHLKGKETLILRAHLSARQKLHSVFSIIKLSSFKDHLGIMRYQWRGMVPAGVIEHFSLRGTAHPRLDLLRNATLDVVSICGPFLRDKVKGRSKGENI